MSEFISSEPSSMGSEVDIALKDVKIPGTTKYKKGDVVKNIVLNKEFKIIEIKDGKYILESNNESKSMINISIGTVDDESIYEIVNGTEAESKEGSKEIEAEFKADVKGTEAEAAKGDTLSTVVSSAPSATSSATSSASVYVIVQISETGEISILDEVPKDKLLNTNDPPMDLLTKKTPSTFAIKITREPGCTENCIDGKYKLGLNEIVSGVPTVSELLSENFLEDGQESASSSASLSEGSSTEDYSEKISYLSLDTSEINENKLEIDEKYFEEAKQYALETIESLSSSDSLSDTDFNKLLNATEILRITDKENKFFNTESNFDKKIEEKLEAKLGDVEKYIIVPDYPEYPKENIDVLGYKIKITDRGGSGNCFYYSVHGGFEYINKNSDFNPYTRLATFAVDTLNMKLDIKNNYDRDSFNILIRSILSHCFLAERDSSDVYKRYLNAWNDNNDNSLKGTDDGVESLDKMVDQLAYGLRSVIKNKVRQYNKNKEIDFFTTDEFATILANNVKMDGIFATEIEVNLIKKILTNCDIILDIMSPTTPINYDNDYLPSKYQKYYYIYVRHTGGEHYQQVELYENGVMCEFSREPKDPVDNLATYWKYIGLAITSKGGSSRRKQKSKSKKTRRKYFVYNK